MQLALVAAMSLAGVLHVRAQAPLGGDGSEDRPFATVGEALAHAADGGTINVEPGLYEEALVLGRPVTLAGTGQVVIAAPPESPAALDARADVRLHNLSIQGGRTGVQIHASAVLDGVRLRGQPDAAIDCQAGASCTLRDVHIDSSFAQAVGVRGDGAVHLRNIEIAGPFRRALDVSGTLDGSGLDVHGAVTGLQASGARVRLRDARFEGLRGACIFGARGQIDLVEPVISGCEVGVEIREGERVSLEGALISRCTRTAFASTEAQIDARDLLVEGPSRDGAVMISGGGISVRDARFRNPGPAAITARLAEVAIENVTVDGARTDSQGDFGDALFLYDSKLSGSGLLARDCQGAAIEAQLGGGSIADVEAENAGQAAIALEHRAKLDLDGLEANGGQGAGLACIEQSSARLRAPHFGKLAGGRWLIDCGCTVRVQPPDPALAACQTPPDRSENRR